MDNLLQQRKKLFEAVAEKKKELSLRPEFLVTASKDELFLKEDTKVVKERMADVNFKIESLGAQWP